MKINPSAPPQLSDLILAIIGIILFILATSI